MNPDRLRFQASEQSQAIVKLIADVEVGGRIMYEQIIQAAGGNLEQGITPVRGFLETARRHLQREKNVVFDVIQGIGIQRLADGEIVGKSKSKLDHVRRSAHRAAANLACAKFENLSATQRNEALCLQSQMGAIKLVSSLNAQHQLQQKIEQGKQLEIGNILSFFKAA